MSANVSWENWPQTQRPLPFISFSMLARTLNISVGSQIPAWSPRWTTSIGRKLTQLSRLSRRSALKVAAVFDSFIPEAFPGDNMRLAASITRPRATMELELFKLIIFELSNNSFRFNFQDDAKTVVGLCNSLGLAKPAILNELFRLAPNEPSILASVHALFMAACAEKLNNLISTMIKCDRRVHNGTHICIRPSHLAEALIMAIKLRDLNLIHLLLSPASRHSIQEGVQNQHLTAVLADLFLDESELTTTIVRKFLSSGIQFHGDQLLSAIRAGNLEVFSLLADHHADLDHEIKADFDISKSNSYPRIRIDALNAAVAATTCSCHECKSREVHTSRFDIDLRHRCQDCEAQAMKMLREVRRRQGIALNDVSAVPLNMLIIAAARGFNDLIRTFAGGHETLNKASKHGLWPLCAAVIFNHLDTCRLLLQMGASPYYRPPISDSESRWLSPLHQAVWFNHVPIARELLNAGAHMEQRDSVEHSKSSPVCRKDESFPSDYLSPLEVAIQRGNRESFEFLLKQGAQLIAQDSYLPDGIWTYRTVDGIDMRKEKLSIITRHLLTASCTGSTELLAALRKCVDQNALGRAWSAALIIAVECSEYPMLAFLLQLEVSQEDLYRSWPPMLREATYYHCDADTIALICQTSVKLDFPDYWLPYAAGALPAEIIRQKFPQIFDSGDLTQQKTSKEKSCLEMAMLNRDPVLPNSSFDCFRANTTRVHYVQVF